MQEQANDTKAIQKTISKLIKTSPSLNNLFNPGQDFKDELNKGKETNEDLFSYVGEEFPSYFILTKDFSKDNPKLCPKNKSFRVAFKTDVEDLYFLRTFDKGLYTFSLENYELSDYSFSLRAGRAVFTCHIPESSIIGEQLIFHYKISNENTDIETFNGSFVVQVDVEDTKKDNINTNTKPPKSNELNLPTIKEVNKDNWDNHNFTEEDALEIRPNKSSYDFFINMDNKYLVIERKNKNNDPIRLNELFKGSLFLFALSMLDNKDYEENISEISKAAKSFARVNIPIINYGEVFKK